MIDEDSDNSEDIIISPNSPECCNDFSRGSNIITDYSSPLKNEVDRIVETYSPEISDRKHVKPSRSESLKRINRKSSVKRKLLGSRPSLNVNIAKKASLLLNLDDSPKPATISKHNKNFGSDAGSSKEDMPCSFRECKKSGNKYLSSSSLFSNDLTRPVTILKHNNKFGSDAGSSKEDTLRCFKKRGKSRNNAMSLSPLCSFYPSIPVSTRKMSSSVGKVCHSYQLTEVNDVSPTIHKVACESCLGLNGSRPDDKNISLNFSNDHNEYDGIIDVNSQPQSMQIDEPSQEIIMVDSEPIDMSSETLVIPSNQNYAEKVKILKPYLENPFIAEKRTKPIDDAPQDDSIVSFTKTPKKGTLLEKAYKVFSTMKKSSALLSHEINVGLRTARGSFVSDVLIVKSIHSVGASFIIECSPLFNIIDSQKLLESSKTPVTETVRIFLYSPVLTKEIKVNSRLVVHFPVLAMFDGSLKKIIVFLEDRAQVITTTPLSNYQQCNTKFIETATNKKCLKIFRYLKSRTSKSILDAVVGNLLIAQSILELDVLHVHKDRQKNKVVLLTLDSEQQFSLLHLDNSEITPVKNEIQADALYTFIGFRLAKYFDISSKMKEAAEYYACGRIANTYMYVFESVEQDFKINLVKKLIPRLRPLSSLNIFSLLNDAFLES